MKENIALDSLQITVTKAVYILHILLQKYHCILCVITFIENYGESLERV